MSILLIAVATGCRAKKEAVPPVTAREDEYVTFLQTMNRGKAYLENRDSAKAIEAFTQAVALDATSDAALRNLARAHLLADSPAARQEAMVVLGQAEKVRADSPATAYLLGIALARFSQFDQASQTFARAAELDPNVAAIRYQLAAAWQAVGKHELAKEQYRQTLRLDPLHSAAHFRLSAYAQEADDKTAYQQHLTEYMRLRRLFGDESRSASALEACIYTRAEPPPAKRSTETAAKPAIDVKFVDATAQLPPMGDRRPVAAAVLDVDDQGRCALVVGDSKGGVAVWRFISEGRWQQTVVAEPSPTSAGLTQCVVGRLHTPVSTSSEPASDRPVHDCILVVGESGCRLLLSSDGTRFEDISQTSGLSEANGRRARWLDYDHDGDLDLITAGNGGVQLWQNNGNATFQNVPGDVGITDIGSVMDAVAVDLDQNVAIDIVTARGEQPSIVFENQRTGRYSEMPQPPGPWPAAKHVLANDLDNDGYADIVLVSDNQALTIDPRSGRRTTLAPEGMRLAGGVLLDYDNDGRLDIGLFGAKANDEQSGSVRLFRNTGNDSWNDVSEDVGLASAPLGPVHQIVAADFDGDLDSDLAVLTSSGELAMLRNDGGHVLGQLKVRLATLKTNPAGIGAHVEYRSGETLVSRSIIAPPIEIGLGGLRRLDTLQIVWTNGVVDNQIDLPVTATPVEIVEKNRATGSCPFLYAWDGTRYRFVTDLLGNSPVGLSIRRGVALPADPDEFVFVGGEELLRPTDGRVRLQITDEFRELLYLDEVKLVAVDHPNDIEVHPTDKLMSPPFPQSQLWALRNPRHLRRAVGDDGIDRTRALQHLDGQFADPGPALPPPLRGMCRPMALTLDFGTLDVSRPWVLVLTGWLQYGDASTNIAASQNPDLSVIPPTLEAELPGGEWVTLPVAVGIPAGKTKTILCDLSGTLPAQMQRLRLRTTFEIRWDRVVLMERQTEPRLVERALKLRSAELAWRGFSDLRSRQPNHPSTPDFEMVSDQPAWRTTPEGWCTRYGDVLELVAQCDNRIAIMNSGDSLTLDFDAPSVSSATGTQRSYFLYTVGWDKDEDHNVIGGESVEPLPVVVPEVEIDAHRDWQLRYNTRWVPHDRFRPR